MSACNKKSLLALSVALASSGAYAELKALDDQALGALTGQAGLTIDLESKFRIGEFMYKDAGSVFFNGISFGANTNETPVGSAVDGYFDNARIYLDVAGANEQLDYGFSGYLKTADIQENVATLAGNADASKFADMASGTTTIADVRSAVGLANNAFAGNLVDASGNVITGIETDASGNSINVTGNQNLTIAGKRTFDDGDLVIHVSYKDAWQKVGGLENSLADGSIGNLSFDEFLGDAVLKAKDFNFSIDAIGLAASTVEAGDTITRDLMGHTSTGADSDGVDTTVLISDLSINGYMGPTDIHIENDGNGFQLLTGFDASGNPQFLQGVGAADSIINWDSYVNITDLDVYLDIAGVRIDDLKINNVRGDVTDLDGNFAFGFAHTKQQIYAVRNTANFNSADFLANHTGLIGGGDILAIINASGEDGVALNTQFKGDMEIGALSFGDTGKSIGSLYWTDIESYTNWTISAH